MCAIFVENAKNIRTNEPCFFGKVKNIWTSDWFYYTLHLFFNNFLRTWASEFSENMFVRLFVSLCESCCLFSPKWLGGFCWNFAALHASLFFNEQLENKAIFVKNAKKIRTNEPHFLAKLKSLYFSKYYFRFRTPVR